jgi:hypothetical protein
MTRALSLLLAAVLCLMARPLHAQPTANTNEALQRAYEADKLFASGKWSEAHEGFAAAEAIAHSPVFVLYMGHCRRNQGKLIEAQGLYLRVSNEKLAEDAPKPFHDAATDARRELQALRSRIPSMKVVGVAKGATLTIDGKPANVGEVTSLDPGPHRVEATHAGKTVRRNVTLSEGAAEPMVVELSSDSVPEAPGQPEEQKGPLAPGIALLTIGGVGVVLGIVTGAIAASMASDIKPNCIDGHCLAEDADKLDTTNILATTSTVGFAVGGAAAVAGIVLIVVRPGGGGDSSAMIGLYGAF